MAAKTKTVEKQAVTVELVKFSKEQLVESTRYSNRRDLVYALLDEKKTYTTDQVDELINKYMKGQVK